MPANKRNSRGRKSKNAARKSKNGARKLKRSKANSTMVAEAKRAAEHRKQLRESTAKKTAKPVVAKTFKSTKYAVVRSGFTLVEIDAPKVTCIDILGGLISTFAVNKEPVVAKTFKSTKYAVVSSDSSLVETDAPVVAKTSKSTKYVVVRSGSTLVETDAPVVAKTSKSTKYVVVRSGSTLVETDAPVSISKRRSKGGWKPKRKIVESSKPVAENDEFDALVNAAIIEENKAIMESIDQETCDEINRVVKSEEKMLSKKRKQKPKDANKTHNTWIVYVRDPSERDQWGLETYKEKATIDSIEGYYRFFDNIMDVNAYDYYIMKKGVKPTYEHNPGGGFISYNFYTYDNDKKRHEKRDSSNPAKGTPKEILMSATGKLIGETLTDMQYSSEILGLVVVRRKSYSNDASVSRNLKVWHEDYNNQIPIDIDNTRLDDGRKRRGRRDSFAKRYTH